MHCSQENQLRDFVIFSVKLKRPKTHQNGVLICREELVEGKRRKTEERDGL